MRKLITCYLIFYLFYYTSTAQTIESSINLYGTNFPQEKIHIQFDKEVYLPGETIWFKAYLFEEELPSERSTNFYAALYDEDGKLIQSQINPIFNSSADGHFNIPDSLGSKQLICRAYTTWMLNFDSTFLFTKTIRLINKNAKTQSSAAVKKVSLHFFPEGGDLIEGTRNTIAFKAYYNNGLPFDIKGIIKKQETGEVIMPLKSLHDGMGRFDLEIQPGEKYYAEWEDNNGAIQQSYLPKAKTEGISLKLVQQNNKLVFNIVNKLSNDSLHVLMYMYQKVFYKTNLAVLTTGSYTGMVPINNLPTGVMQLTVFDANWQPVAERVAFINNNNYTAGAGITNTETSIQKRGKNIIEIEVTDTIPANMSLSITDNELNNEGANSTIVTNLLLSGDVKGYIYNPAYYFTNNTDDNLKARLDLVMLTHGWRRYKWDDMLAQKMPVINFPGDDYLSVYGQVSKTAMEKMPKEENINLIIKTKDSTNNFYSVQPDATGLIKQTGLIFYDTAKVLFSFNKNKSRNTQISFSSSNFTHAQLLTISNYREYHLPDTTGTQYRATASLLDNYNSIKNNRPFNAEKTLEEVVVKSGGWHNWKNDPLYKMDQKYTDFTFKGGAASQGFDVLHDEMAAAKLDIFHYMLGKAPGLKIVYPPFGALSYLGDTRGAVTLYIDERLVELEEAHMLDIQSVAYIKYIPMYGGLPGLPPVLSIYLKKGDDLIDKSPKDTDLQSVKIPGHSPVKEFYSPDYSQTNTTTNADTRITLLWQPYILTDAATQKIPITFYNNDFSRKLKLVLEGVNAEGKLIHVEKLIE